MFAILPNRAYISGNKQEIKILNDMKILRTIAVQALILSVAVSAQAQQPSALEQYYAAHSLQVSNPRMEWAGDGNALVTRTPGSDEATDIITGKTVTLSTSGIPVRNQGAVWSEDGTKALLKTAGKKVWRYETKNAYSVYFPIDGSTRELGKGFEPVELMFAKFSPDGNSVAYVYKNNLYLEDIASGNIRPLTTDGGGDIVNGTSDWVYEEELGLRDGFRWSPDGRYIAFWQFNTSGTGTFYMINNVDSIYSKPIPLPYPKVGTTNSAVKVGVVTVADGSIRWFDIPGDPRENYLATMDFIPGSDEVMIQQLDRRQQVNSVWYGDVRDMSLKKVYEDRDEAFLDVNDDIVWLEDGNYFLWTSEKDGWRHLYRVSRDGSSEMLVTKGDFDVVSIAKLDIKGGYVYFYATPEYDAVHRYLYRSRLDGKKDTERLTPESFAGANSYSISANSKYAVHTFSNVSTPTYVELVSLPGHKTIKVLEDNAAYKAEYDKFGFRDVEYFKVDIGEVILDAWMMKPKDFDPSKKYPVIFHVYGEPASSTVTDRWNVDLWNRFLNENGYVVMSVDPRGTNNPRGREWRKSIYGKIGIVPIEDHAKAVKEIEKMYDWVDADRIGVWGWSGGGSSTASLMFKHPEIYKTGIAVAGVYNQLCYDSIYQERYMGLPSDNPEGYFNGSAINSAAGLQGNLMIIHGTGDDNVHYQAMEMLINEMVKNGKMFSMMTYPMRTHSINEREGTSMHLYNTMLNYWLKNL